MNFQHPPSTAVLAFVSIVHLALVALRAHRSAGGALSGLTGVSLLFTASPWLMPGVAGLAIGLVTHVAWFGACERLGTSPAGTRAAAARGTAAAPTTARLTTAAPSATSTRPPTSVTAQARRQAVPVAPTAKPASGFVETRVMAVFAETSDTRSFRMARPDGFEFKAGQFLTLRVRADDKDHVRCYSISSSPDARGHLEVTVKRHGLVSGALHATVRPGTLLSVRPPAGAFVYPAGDERPLLLIAGGVGITPLMSMLRYALDTEPMRPVVLLYSVRTPADVVFGDEIGFLNRRHAQFRAVVVVTGGSALAGQYPGRIDAALLNAAVPDLVHSICLLCGPPKMITDITALLVSLGVPKAQVRNEVFETAVAASAGRTPAPATAPSPVAAERGFDVQFTASGVGALVTAETTLLEASERCGADIPSLCRAGVCGTCRVRVESGDVDCASQILSDDDRQDGFVLPCVSRVRSDCRVEA